MKESAGHKRFHQVPKFVDAYARCSTVALRKDKNYFTFLDSDP